MPNEQIKKLLTTLPRGAPFDTATLAGLGIAPDLAHHYVKSGWLEKLGRGVFMFTGDTLDQDATLGFLAKKIPSLHLAAKTALARHGFRHNVARDEVTILWSNRPNALPEWFQNRFPSRYSTLRLFDDTLPDGYALSSPPGAPDGQTASEPERALLEMLSEVGVHQEVDEARNIMEGVRQLRTARLAKLLSACRMVKAARLCVVWAEELGLPWAAKAREAAKDSMGTGRWIGRLKDGSTLILKP